MTRASPKYKESEIELACRLYAESLGGQFYKWTSPGTTGVPDRILVLPNCPAVFVEMKKPGGQLSARQYDVLGDLLMLGQRVWVLERLEDFKHLTTEHYKCWNQPTSAKINAPLSTG